MLSLTGPVDRELCKDEREVRCAIRAGGVFRNLVMR